MQSGLKKPIIDKINSVFSGFDEVEQAMIYGSRAKGNEERGSDIDLMLQGERLTLSRLNSIQNKLDDLLLPWHIDLVIMHQVDNPYLLAHIARVGKVIYRKG